MLFSAYCYCWPFLFILDNCYCCCIFFAENIQFKNNYKLHLNRNQNRTQPLKIFIHFGVFVFLVSNHNFWHLLVFYRWTVVSSSNFTIRESIEIYSYGFWFFVIILVVVVVIMADMMIMLILDHYCYCIRIGGNCMCNAFDP